VKPLDAIHRKISDCMRDLENMLSHSEANIAVKDTIDAPLENAVLEIIAQARMTDSEKDAAITQLGSIQQSLKQGLDIQMTAMQANRIKCAIGIQLNWGGETSISEQLKPAYRAVYASLRTAIHTAVPEAINLDERLVNLYAAKSELETLTTSPAKPKESHPVVA